MRVCLMIEGQEGVTWEQWVALAETAERAGLEALFRSDHYSGFHGGAGGSLDAWATICALAPLTTTIRLGTLVSPATFRHPSVLARMAVTADHVSRGRVEVGLGAGWNEREHVQHGFPFATARERVERFAEQLEIVRRSWTEDNFDFDGRYYTLRGAEPLPKPLGPINLIVGGSAKRGTALPAARYADEYNTVGATAEEAARRRQRVLEACAEAGRPPLTFSLMTLCVIGADRREVDARLARLEARTGSARPPAGALVGTIDEVAAQLRELEDAGVERVMLQHLLHDDLPAVEQFGALATP